MTACKKSRFVLNGSTLVLSCFLLMAMGRCGGDNKGEVPLESQADTCGEYLSAKTCTKTKADKECEWKDDTCQEKPEALPNECHKKSDKDECQKDDKCLYKDNKCIDADPSEAGTCNAIKAEPFCNGHQSSIEKKKCYWDAAAGQCQGRNAKKITVRTLTKVDAAAIASNNVNRVVISRDKQYAYFSSLNNTVLSLCHIEGAANFGARMADASNAAVWTPSLSLSPGAANPAVFNSVASTGKADLDGADKIHTIAPTERGIILTTTSPKANATGTSYLEGGTYKAAWANEAGSVDVIPLSGSDRTKPYFGNILRKMDGNEYLYLFASEDGKNYKGATGGPIYSPAGGANPHIKIANSVSRLINPFKSVPLFASGAGSDGVYRGYLVDEMGINIILDEDIGKAFDFPKFEKGSALRFVNWRVTGHGAANNEVNALVLHGGKLYIALGGGKPATGGIAIFDPVSLATVRPPKLWSGLAVIDLSIDGNGTIWAVLSNKLVPIDPATGAMDNARVIDKASIDAAQFTNDYGTEVDNTVKYSGTLTNFDQLTSAQWVGEQLIITTANEGAYFTSVKEEVLP